ncbi:Methyltransferase [Rasamsonia emersonii CBS 393.64]|uniref:Methyltransferase n=1 Tax=Rasamsonia emersonii (strain ATCC 16479 / CBS 393.64 / IMI 116815) TaxID=1408163 RepID=A0A0F4YFC7_RASE3|nr:Methyltransferase [Rasamsonia emersonii CBS 393.64]KKA16947.1 Methyltransferase [Rasamsonia emersonii CBS 393.64]
MRLLTTCCLSRELQVSLLYLSQVQQPAPLIKANKQVGALYCTRQALFDRVTVRIHRQEPPSRFLFKDGGDPAELVDSASETTSLASSVKAYVYEVCIYLHITEGEKNTTKEHQNGRRYHSYHEGEYVLPNDEEEQDRLDLSHHIYKMLLGGELYLAPVGKRQRVLDMGTVTGIWAIDFAECEHQLSHILSLRLTKEQVPPNCRFQIDDFEKEWAYSRPFDFIHGRDLEGSVRDYDQLFRQAFQNLKPGGYLEMASMEINTHSDDGTHLKAKNFLKGLRVTHEASKKFGKDMNSVATWKEKMERAGFENVTEKIYKDARSSLA